MANWPVVDSPLIPAKIPIADHQRLWNVVYMPGRFILTFGAITLFVVGGAALFGPDEISHSFDPAASRGMVIAIQLFGGSLMGFAIMDWMGRKNRIGGIYARPLGLGNLVLFTTAALTLGKASAAGHLPTWTAGICALFAILAISFGWLVFGHDPVADRPATLQS